MDRARGDIFGDDNKYTKCNRFPGIFQANTGCTIFSKNLLVFRYQLPLPLFKVLLTTVYSFGQNLISPKVIFKQFFFRFLIFSKCNNFFSVSKKILAYTSHNQGIACTFCCICVLLFKIYSYIFEIVVFKNHELSEILQPRP